MPRKEKRLQVVLVVVVALVLIALTVAGTLVLSGKMPGFSNSFTSNYQNVTLTDAYVICEQKARDSFAGRLKSLEMDDHSSRLDTPANRYRIFINVELFEGSGRGALAEEYFVNCFVRADNATISTFDYAKDSVPGRDDSGGNVFGFPR